MGTVAAGGGWIIAGEADLHSLPIAFLEKITGLSAQVVLNRWQGSPWQIEAPMPLNLKYEPSPALMGKAAISRILDELDAGRRVAVATDSQRWGEVLERAVIKRGCSVLRLDGSTAEESWAHELMAAPDEYLAQAQAQLFIYSPTAESGLSITGNHFDIQICYGSHLEHRAIAQLMGRIRADIPRVLYCRESSMSDESGGSMDPEQLLGDWKLNARYSAMACKLGADAPSLEQGELADTLHQFAARYQARINISRANLRGGLLAALQSQGHQISGSIQSPLDGDIEAELKAIRQDIEIERSEEFAAADISQLTPEKAHRILASSSSKREERVPAEKLLTLESYPGLPVDDADFVLRNITKSRAKNLKAHTALFMAQHPEVAAAIDRVSWQSQAESKILWLPSIKKEAPKATVLQQSGILELFELAEYREESPEVQRVRDFALHYQADIKRVLGLWCAQHHSGIQIVNKLARRVGMVAKIARHEGPRGEQIKIWHWDRNASIEGDRAAIHAALTRKWSELLEPLQQEESNPVSSISDKRNTLSKIEDTAPQTPITQEAWVASWAAKLEACCSWEEVKQVTEAMPHETKQFLWKLLKGSEARKHIRALQQAAA